ncbi:MAG: YncE family protein [Peptostreptococcaceae bacterium]
MKLYISNYLSKSISIIDYYTFEVEKEISLEENIHPHHFCIDKEKKIMYIPSSSDGVIYIVDLNTDELIDTVSAGGNLSQIALCNNELFIANEDSDSIYILDRTSLMPVGIIGLDYTPHGLDFDEESNRLYISCIHSIICVDVVSKQIVNQINLDFKAWHIKLNKQNNEIYISTLDGKVIVVDLKNMKIKKILSDFLLPLEMKFNYKNKKVYIADLGYKNIKILESKTGKYVGNISVDGIPQGLEISEDGKFLFVSDTQNNSIKIYNCITNQLVKDVKVGKEPTTIICL